ncbi:MAG: hypothetical protein IPM21_00150 [Acidobacteria bacterium]|nr:hypothetical protein [Acidobacteriota bacterium]
MTGLLNAVDDRGVKLRDLIFTPIADNNELQLYEKSNLSTALIPNLLFLMIFASPLSAQKLCPLLSAIEPFG